MADQYANGKRPKSAPKQLENAGMSEDEIDFLENVKEKKEKTQPDNAIDWFSVLEKSHKTYTSVKSVFEKAGINVDSAEDNVTSKLVNECTELLSSG